MKHPLADALANIKDPHILLQVYRLLPYRGLPAGTIVWSRPVGDSHQNTVSAPGAVVLPPPGTDTAWLSVSDYRIVTAEIAFREEQSCQ